MSDGLSDIESVTLRVVDHHTEEGFLFTALDISNIVKQSLPGVRHREVAPIVRSLYESGKLGADYTRSNIDVTAGGKSVTAFLYHLDEDDPDDYAGTQRQQTAIAPVPVAVIRAAAGAFLSQVDVQLGRDGRARLPLDFIRGAGLNSDEIAVSQDVGPNLRLADHVTGTQPPPLTVLHVLHPTVLHLPMVFLNGFDLTKPILAHARSGAVVIEGA